MSHDISWLSKCRTFCKQRLMFIHIYITLVRLAGLSTKKQNEKLHHCLYECMYIIYQHTMPKTKSLFTTLFLLLC